MKTSEQLEMIKKIPLENLLLETGASDGMENDIPNACSARRALVFFNWRARFEKLSSITTTGSSRLVYACIGTA